MLRNPDMIAEELRRKSASKALAQNLTAQSQEVRTSEPVLEQVTKAKQQAEADAILAALNAARWNRTKAAALLKIHYKALLYKMKQLGINEEATSPPKVLAMR